MRFAGFGRNLVKSVFGRQGHVVGSGGDYDAALVDSLDPELNPSNVQADLDKLAPISTAAQLEARYPAVGGVHTITEGVVLKLLPGASEINITPKRLHFVKPGGVSSEGRQPIIRSDVDGTFVTGEPAVDNVAFMNGSFGASAKVLEAVYTEFGSLRTITLFGQRPGSMTNLSGSIDNILIIPLAPGAESFEFLGAVGPVTVGPSAGLAPGTAPWTVFKVPASATLIALDLSNPLLNSAHAGDRLIELDAGMTIPSTAIIVFDRPRVEGPGDMFAAGFSQASDEVISRGGIGARDSQWLGAVAFDGGGTPLIVTHSATPGTGVVMPTENVGPTAVLTELPNQEGFDLNIDAIQDWNIKGTRRIDNRTARVSWAASAQKSGGSAREFLGWVEYSADNGANWFLVEGTKASNPIDIRDVTIQGDAIFTYDRACEFRLMVASEDVSATDAVSSYKLTVFT